MEAEYQELVDDSKQEFTFKNVQLLKNETLGTGSYGAVCKAKCDQLICAAKLLYPVLLSFQMVAPDPGKEHRQPFRRFEQECQFLKCINHPNIVQYLGMYRDPETNAPVLLMELMDESLTHFLESSPEHIPYHIQVNLSHDIAQALAFLHANGIIHRDLSSNNVLLIAGSRAKITDFGMLKITDVEKTRVTMTTCPGTPAFMSPESLNEPPVYTEKLDTFSVGVLLIQILTRKFPSPTDRFESMELCNPLNPSHMIEALVPIPEIERRQAHINLIEPTHPLLPIALECLNDRDMVRPSSQQLCQSLDAFKLTEKYRESYLENKSQIINQQLQEQVRAKDQQIQTLLEDLTTKDTENRQLSEICEEALRENQAKDSEIGLLRATLQQEAQTRDREMIRLNQQILSLQQEIAQREREVNKQRETLSRKNSEITTLRQLEEAKENQMKALEQQRESNVTFTLQQTITQKDCDLREQKEMLLGKQDEIEQLCHQLEDKDDQLRAIEESSQEIISTLQHAITQREEEIAKLKSENSDTSSQITTSRGTQTTPTSNEASSLECTAQLDSPVDIFAGSSTVIGCKLYFKPRYREATYEFNSTNHLWHELTPHPLMDYTILSINYLLTSVGGGFENRPSRYSNQLYSYRNGKWENNFPSMPTKRTCPAAVSTSNILVVAGGINETGILDTVEIIDLRLKEWSTVSSLPFQVFQPSAAICGDHIYLHPRYKTRSQDIVKCSLEQLIYSKPKLTKWRSIRNLAVSCSTLTTINGHLLALGG